MEKARAALTRYHARLSDRASQPVWFERSFAFRLGPHHLRGRVDRVDRLTGGADAGAEPDGAAAGVSPSTGDTPFGGTGRQAGAEYELIDYKTSHPRTAEQLAGDVQLSLYALAAREAWGLESSRQAYYYVLDDLIVPVSASAHDAKAVEDVVLAVGEGILAQRFEPTPSRAVCSLCDYRIVCSAAAG
jgi:DNA helicase-2/ATP-dependent DNA helicase PcrA